MAYTIKDVEVTKKTLIKRVANEMTSYRVYKVNFRANIVENDTLWWRSSDIVVIYDEDVCEYADKDRVSKTETNKIVNEFIYTALDYLVGMTTKQAYTYIKDHYDSWARG